MYCRRNSIGTSFLRGTVEAPTAILAFSIKSTFNIITKKKEEDEMDIKQTYLNDLKEILSHSKEKLSTLGQGYKNQLEQQDSDNLASSLKEVLETAQDSYAKLQLASEEEWEDIKNKADQSFQTLQETFEKAFGSSWKNLKNCMNGAEKHTQEFIEIAEEYIKKNLFKSLLIAVGLGYFFRKILK